MHLRSRCFSFLLSLVAVSAGACSTSSNGGQPCKQTGGLLNGGYSCDNGLVCNTGDPTPTCESPNTRSAGEPCGLDDNCKAGLWCDVRTCSLPLTVGVACPTGEGCAAGLVCSKSSANPTCVPEDAGAGDAAAEDAGAGDAGAEDAGAKDAAAE
jgi:hypothetical protein